MGTLFSSMMMPPQSAEAAAEIIGALIPQRKMKSAAMRAAERMLYRGTAGECCAAFSRWEVSRRQSWCKIRKIFCAAVFGQLLISVFAVVSTARKSSPADRWRERILRKLRRLDPDLAKPRRDLAGRVPSISPAKTRVFRQA